MVWVLWVEGRRDEAGNSSSILVCGDLDWFEMIAVSWLEDGDWLMVFNCFGCGVGWLGGR